MKKMKMIAAAFGLLGWLVAMTLLAQPAEKSLTSAQKKVDDAAAKLAELRGTMQKLLSAVDSAHADIVAATGDLEDAKAEVAKAERDISRELMAEQLRIIKDMRKVLLGVVKPEVKQKKSEKSDIFGDVLPEQKLPPKSVLKPKFDSEDYRPKGSPKDLGSVDKDGATLTWWTYDQRPSKVYLFQGDNMVGVWDQAKSAYFRASANTVIGDSVAQAPVPLPRSVSK